MSFLGNKITFHHIGMVVGDISKYARVSDVIIDDINGVKVFMWELPGITIEIVEPINKSSPAYGPLKNGNSLYHLAFTTTDIKYTLAQAKKKGFTLLRPGSPAKAFGDNNIYWIFNEQFGLIEIIAE